MKKTELMKAYGKAVSRSGFSSDLSQDPWLPQLSPGYYKEVKQLGTLQGVEAVLRLIPDKHLPENWAFQQKIRDDYSIFSYPGAVKLPRVLTRDRFDDFNVLIYESPHGSRIVPYTPGRPPLITEIGEAATVCWATELALRELSHSSAEVMRELESWSSLTYFINRLEKWFALARKNHAIEHGFMDESVREKVVDYLLHPLRRGMKMEISFNLFGNTDIVKTREREYFLVNGELEVKPNGFTAAAFLWNLVMYSWWQHVPSDLFGVLKKLWLPTFNDSDPENRFNTPNIGTNLVERCIAALLVDLPDHRSPYDKPHIGVAEIRQSADNFTYALNEILTNGLELE